MALTYVDRSSPYYTTNTFGYNKLRSPSTWSVDQQILFVHTMLMPTTAAPMLATPLVTHTSSSASTEVGDWVSLYKRDNFPTGHASLSVGHLTVTDPPTENAGLDCYSHVGYSPTETNGVTAPWFFFWDSPSGYLDIAASGGTYVTPDTAWTITTDDAIDFAPGDDVMVISHMDKGNNSLTDISAPGITFSSRTLVSLGSFGDARIGSTRIHAWRYTVLSGSGTVTPTVGASSAFTVGGKISAVVVRLREGEAPVVPTYDGAADLTAQSALGDVIGDITVITPEWGEAALTAETVLASDASVYTPVLGFSDLTAETDLAADAAALPFAESWLSAETDLTADGTSILDAGSDLSAQSELSAAFLEDVPVGITTDGTVIPLGGAHTWNATVNMAGSLDAAGTAGQLEGARLDMSAQTELTAAGGFTAFAHANLSGGSIIISDGGPIRLGTATIGGSATLVGTAGQTFAGGQSYLDATLVVEAAGGVMWNADSNLTAQSGMSVVKPGAVFAAGTVDLSSSTNFTFALAPLYRLNLPTNSRAFTRDRLWSRFPVKVGVALLITGGEGRMVENPSDSELKAADFYFLGGYRHQISPVERAAVVAAGYGDLIEEA